MCIKKIPSGFHVIIVASSGGYVSRQINVVFPLSQSTLRVRCNACGKGFRDCVKVKAVLPVMEKNTFTAETTNLINMNWAVVVDAMYPVQRWSFHKDETFVVVARRYRNHIPIDIQTGTDIIHFCCLQQHRYAWSRPARYTQSPSHNMSSLYLPTRPFFPTSCVKQSATRSSLSRHVV